MPRQPPPEFEVETADGPPDPEQVPERIRRASDQPDPDGGRDGPREDAPGTRSGDEDEDDDEDEDVPPADDGKGITDDELNKIKQGVKALKWISWPTAPGKRVCLRPLSRLETYQGAA